MSKSSRDKLFDELDQINFNVKMAKGRLKEYERKRDELNAEHFRMTISANEERRKELLNEIRSLNSD